MKKLITLLLTLCILSSCCMPVRAETLSEPLNETEEPLKRNIADAHVGVSTNYFDLQRFNGLPAEPSVRVYFALGEYLTQGKDYVVTYENNINMGTAIVRVIGVGDYYGSVTQEFQITNPQQEEYLPSLFVGYVGDELSDLTEYAEYVISPGPFKGSLRFSTPNHAGKCMASFELYQLVGEEMVLVTTYQPVANSTNEMFFQYDFSHVYEESSEKGGEIYLLSYAWIDKKNAVRTGTTLLIVPAKVPDGTQMVVEKVPDAEDFRYAYLSAYSPDGDLGPIGWSSSDPSVARVENGVVTKLKPGTVTITGEGRSLTSSYTLTIEQQNLAAGATLSYVPQTGAANVYYQGHQLEVQKDYIFTVTPSGTNTEVTVTGCGLFGGQLIRTFDAAGDPVGHTHSFDYICDTTCNSCDYTRITQHQSGTEWEKNMTGHWRVCTVCGEKTDYAIHTISAEDDKVCVHCGLIGVSGDLDDDGEITDWDGVLLARYLAGWTIPNTNPVAMDIDGDSEVTDWDGVLLDRYLAGWNVTLG